MTDPVKSRASPVPSVGASWAADGAGVQVETVDVQKVEEGKTESGCPAQVSSSVSRREAPPSAASQ